MPTLYKKAGSPRVRHRGFIDTTIDIVEACDLLQIHVILLKGISVSEQVYPEEHLRPMSDIDVLIPAGCYAAVERALLERGYCKLDGAIDEAFHHGPPLQHPARGTVVELHRKLFPDDSPLSENSVFCPSTVAMGSVPSIYHGRSVRRLSFEWQLPYIASSWCNDLTLSRIHPSFLASLFDAIYLLDASSQTFDWDAMHASVDNEMANASLYVMLTYLQRYGAKSIPASSVYWLSTKQALVGPVQLKVIHWMLDRHLVAGRPWDAWLPLPVPGRYSFRYQIKKRGLNRLRRRRLD